MDGSSWRFSEPSTYANANLVPTARKPSPEGQLKICTDTPEVNRFREKRPVRTQNSENGVVRGQQVETKNPTERGARLGYRPVREWFCQCYWRGRGIRTVDSEVPFCPCAINHLQIRKSSFSFWVSESPGKTASPIRPRSPQVLLPSFTLPRSESPVPKNVCDYSWWRRERELSLQICSTNQVRVSVQWLTPLFECTAIWEK